MTLEDIVTKNFKTIINTLIIGNRIDVMVDRANRYL